MEKDQERSSVDNNGNEAKETDLDSRLSFEDEDTDEDTKALFFERNKARITQIQERQKPALAKASRLITLDVNPLDTEADLGKLEEYVRSIKMPGLTWLGGELIAVAYGIRKLRILCKVTDGSIDVDTIQEEIQNNADFVSSTDLFAVQNGE